MRIDDFDYELPGDLIAQHPAAQRGASRLLHLDAGSGALRDCSFADLPGFLRPGDLMVFNDTKVIKARLRGTKETGGKVEALIERILSPHRALAMLKASHAPRPGQQVTLSEGIVATIVERRDDFFVLEFEGDVASILERHGELPLPPYINHPAGSEDESRYQTVFARSPGAVAAPTAGLHFDRGMVDRLKESGVQCAYITLHVGAGTFQPVRVDEVEQHVMHGERYEISDDAARSIGEAQSRGGRIMAVGTTTLRALESAASQGPVRAGAAETRLFVRPGYHFRLVDRLLTNFHLPRSTLLILVSAFGGIELMRRAYDHAIRARYRFFSYGDAMLIERAPAVH